MELETAVRLKTNLVRVIWIDGAYDMVAVREVQKIRPQVRMRFWSGGSSEYAEAFGATGLMIRRANEIIPVLKKAFDTSGSVIVGIHVDYSDNHKLFEMVDESAFQ